MTVADCHDFAPFPAARRADSSAPLFRPAERGVDKGFGEIDLAAVSQIFCETLQEHFQAPGALPQLEAAMTRLVRRIAARQIVPRRAGAKDPQHAVQHGAWFDPRTPTSVSAPARTKHRFQDGPLLVGEIHAQGTTGPCES